MINASFEKDNSVSDMYNSKITVSIDHTSVAPGMLSVATYNRPVAMVE